MTGLDTNILIYSIDRREAVKRARARQLLRQLHADRSEVVLPWQVIGEFVRYLRSAEDRGQIARSSWMRYVQLLRRQFPLVMPTEVVLDRALDLSGRFSLSHWDSMLLGACVEAGIDRLYTEDMGSPTLIGGIQLVNPFS
jgi:predicted nucleic acid-binding protein